jgi:hypothetical protein
MRFWMRLKGSQILQSRIDTMNAKMPSIRFSNTFVRSRRSGRFPSSFLSQYFSDPVTQPVLPHSKYFTAIGSITDAAIFRLISDILALPDITEVESHRLSELCRILNALEGLFSENDGQVNPLSSKDMYIFDTYGQSSLVVQFVHGWLKFSYLTELLVRNISCSTPSY